jgi:hypothetical protein
MDPQFQELASEIADAVEKRLSGAFEERLAIKIEERLSGAFEQRVKTHIDQFEQRADLRLKTHIDQFEKRAELRMQMHFENLEKTVTLAAEGYGATLQQIERGLGKLGETLETKFGDHDSVLKDHSRRIIELEKRV